MIRIISLTEQGRRLGARLQGMLSGAVHWHKPSPFMEQVRLAFEQGDALLFICATGIVVRTLGPVLNNKYDDPPVLVIDEQGAFVIPLLSGHEGGANDWGRDVANRLDAQLVITSAHSYLQPVYVVGMGCERGCPESVLQALLENCVAQVGLTMNQIESLHSIDVKADEPGLIALGRRLGKSFQTWTANELGTVESQLSIRSDYVYQTVGVYGVAESAALVGAASLTDNKAELVLNKQKNAQATCAIARSYLG